MRLIYEMAFKAIHGFECPSAGQKSDFARPPGRFRARRAIHGPHTDLQSNGSFDCKSVLIIDPNAARPAEQAKAAALAALGLEVTLLAPRRARENYRQLHAPASWRLPFRLVLGDLRGKPPNRCLFFSGLTKALDPPPQAILVLADENFWLTGQALAWRRLLAPKALFLCHSWRNLNFDRHWHPQPSRLLYALDTWLEALVFARADAIMARNREAVEVLRGRGYGGGVVYIPWGVDTGLFQPPAAPPPARPYTVGFVGRFSPEKGLEDLLAASRLLSMPHRLLLVGGGPLEPAVRRWAARAGPGRVKVSPLVEHGDMPRVYAAMDALVLPSRQVGFEKEQFGRVLAEAMACGVAVVGSDCGAIPEVIGDAGLVYPQGDAPALAACLGQLADPQRRAPLARAGLRRARELFSWRAWAQATAGVLRDLAAGGRLKDGEEISCG
jgi:glycosyltransferase involved in cell wall biosynthesis